MSMSIRAFAAVLLTAFLAVISVARADEPKDAYGDPLPAGAKARLGTARGAGWGRRDLTLLPPDYKSFVACESNRGVVICDLESGRTLKRFAQGKTGYIDLVAVSADGKTSRDVAVRHGHGVGDFNRPRGPDIQA